MKSLGVVGLCLGLVGGACTATDDSTRHGSGGAGVGGAAGTLAAGAGGRSGSGGAAASGAGSGGSGGMIVGGGGGGGVVTGDAGLPAFDAGTDPNRNKVQANQLCERLATIQCAGEQHCCYNPGRDFNACYETMRGACANTAHLNEIAANPITAFDAVFAEQAYTQLEQMASACDPNVASWGSSVAGLRGILRGTVPPGSACTPATSDLTNPVVAGAALASCTGLETHACLPQTLGFKWSCDPKNQAGGRCFTDVNCVDGVYCDNPDLMILPTVTCKARKAEAAACVNPNECLSLFCKGGRCAPVNQQSAYCLQN